MISSVGLVIGVIFLLVPLIVAYIYRIDMPRHILVSFCRMLFRLVILAIVLYYLMQWDNWLTNIAFMFLVVGYSSVSVLVKTRLRVRQYGIPVASGLLVATLLATCGILLIVALSDNVVNSRFFLPFIGFMSGGVVEGQSKALSVYYSGLRNHNQLYYYLTGNGATREEALNYLMRRAVQKSLLPSIGKMAGMAVGVVPVVVWTMIMCGSTIFDAIAMQIILTLAVFFASVIAVIVSLTVARRYSLNIYGSIISKAPNNADD